jgi:hypothetical protein
VNLVRNSNELERFLKDLGKWKNMIYFIAII